MAGLYVHIPFCHAKCAYCDFYSTPRVGDMERVADGLIAEFEARRAEVEAPFDTIYIGGGTPSILPAPTLERLFARLPVGDATEITLEANPEDITPEKTDLWRRLGVNRVSIGVQSLDPTLLRWLGRRHSADDAVRAIETLLSRFDNVSADLIYGIPGLDSRRLRADLERLASLGVAHLSAYTLTYHEGTPLWARLEKGEFAEQPDDAVAEQFDTVRHTLRAEGFEHYEISNFARPGRRSRHNSAYWSPRAKWLGIGPSAHSFDGVTRRIDHPEIAKWLAALPMPYEIDFETELDRVNDFIITALRTSDGLDTAFIPEKYRARLARSAARFVDDGLMTLADGRYTIPQSHWLISDSILRSLLLD